MPICSKSHLAAGRWEGKRTRFILVNLKAGDAGLGVEGRIRLLSSASPRSEGCGAKRSKILPQHGGPNRNVLHVRGGRATPAHRLSTLSTLRDPGSQILA